ncbi:MAG: hypothetical protein S0880_30140 [Actinomycetota bacterium]|nr:hypothetical protein [Actinomycetota bacterium]
MTRPLTKWRDAHVERDVRRVDRDAGSSRLSTTAWAFLAVAATLLSIAFVVNVVWAVSTGRGWWQLIGIPAAAAFWYWAVSVARERIDGTRPVRGGDEVEPHETGGDTADDLADGASYDPDAGW